MTSMKNITKMSKRVRTRYYKHYFHIKYGRDGKARVADHVLNYQNSAVRCTLKYVRNKYPKIIKHKN